MAAARLLQAFRRRRRQQRIEFLMQAELLAQGLAQLVVIVDDEDLARIAHRPPLRLHSAVRVVFGAKL